METGWSPGTVISEDDAKRSAPVYITRIIEKKRDINTFREKGTFLDTVHRYTLCTVRKIVSSVSRKRRALRKGAPSRYISREGTFLWIWIAKGFYVKVIILPVLRWHNDYLLRKFFCNFFLNFYAILFIPFVVIYRNNIYITMRHSITSFLFQKKF